MADIHFHGAWNVKDWSGLNQKAFIKKADEQGMFPHFKGKEREDFLKEAHKKINGSTTTESSDPAEIELS